MTRQRTVEASTHRGADDSLLSQQLDGRLASVDSLRIAARFFLAVILSADEVLLNLGTFLFMTLHLFSAAGPHTSAVVELLSLIEIL